MIGQQLKNLPCYVYPKFPPRKASPWFNKKRTESVMLHRAYVSCWSIEVPHSGLKQLGNGPIIKSNLRSWDVTAVIRGYL